jgi:hypothetical protein
MSGVVATRSFRIAPWAGLMRHNAGAANWQTANWPTGKLATGQRQKGDLTLIARALKIAEAGFFSGQLASGQFAGWPFASLPVASWPAARLRALALSPIGHPLRRVPDELARRAQVQLLAHVPPVSIHGLHR